MLRRTTAVVATALALQAVPSLAAGPQVVRPVVLTRPLAALASVALGDARMVAVTRSSGQARTAVRWHTAAGWGPWSTAEDDTGEDPAGTPGTAPLWRPAGADRVQLRTSGTARGLRLVTVADGVAHRTWGGAPAQAATGRDVLGTVHSRAEWGADESLRRGAPRYAARVDAVVVHHTANANGYRPQDVPALIRADYAYHVRTRGWSDLGYNLLVDSSGRVWEGRAGGLGRAVVGSHAQGFNTGTLGVAVLGDMTQAQATTATRKALARVIGYAAATWRFDPRGSVTLTSQGSPRYPAGRRVVLPRVFGHRQTSVTACPGSLQDALPALRQLAVVAMSPAPALTDVRLSGAPVHAPTPARLTARVTRPARWTAAVTDGSGRVVARATGSGTTPALSWDGTRDGLPVLPGDYRWAIAADDGFHAPARRTGTFAVGLPLLPG